MPSLSIRNQEAYRLIKELADLEGTSMTAVVIEAVREKLERDRKAEIDHARVAHFLKMGQEVRAVADPDWLTRDLTAELYDETGLPK